VPAESATTDKTPEPDIPPVEPAPGPHSDREPESEPASEPASEPEVHRLVTSTRRRTARRAAGPPSPVGDVAPVGGAGKQAAPSAEPVDVPVEPAGARHAPDPQQPAPVAEPDPRAEEEAATGIHADPTWPTDAKPEDEHGDRGSTGDGEENADSGDVDDDSASASSLLHVPIKRKGSRKR